jgi:hypothetical protein
MTYGSVSVDSVVTSSGQTLGAGNATSFKNRIINGAMTIDQRNAGASVTPASGAVTYVLDRWNFFVTQSSKLTVQQSSIAPVGFTRSTLVTSSSAYSVVSSDRFQTTQPIEGFNVADLGWGTANAQTVTLSFRVRSSLTGTFGGAIKNGDGTRSYPFTYTISSANTFEDKAVTISGDTTGTWNTNNTSGILITFGLGVGTTFSGTAGAWAGANFDSVTGATSVVGTSGATFYITGVQFEVGSAATSFDYRSIGTELALCQRYYEKSYELGTVPGTSATSGSHWFTSLGSTPNVFSSVLFSVQKRASPTISVWDTDGNSNKASSGNSSAVVTTNNTQAVPVHYVGNSGITLRQSNGISGAVTVGYQWVASAEL